MFSPNKSLVYLLFKVVKAEEAVGKRLAFDVTKINERFKGAVFKRGHVVRAEDVEILKDSGHYYVYVEEESEELKNLRDEIGEVEAVYELGRFIVGDNVEVHEADEGKAVITSKVKGIVKINSEALKAINTSGVFVVVTRRNNDVVDVGSTVGIVDLIPLTIPRSYLNYIKDLLSNSVPVVYVKPFNNLRVGLVITGTEIFEGRVEDKAYPVVKDKVVKYGGVLEGVVKVPDDKEVIKSAIREFINSYDVVIVTGGMSVDPTDFTPKAIAEVSDEVVIYGIPIKPNTMTMVAYLEGKPIIGVSSAIIYFRDWNVLDLLLPRVMAGDRIFKEDLITLGEGGLTEAFLKGMGRY